jgi:hypothetical protein
MDSDGKFWVSVWAMASVVIVSIVLTTCSADMKGDKIVAEMVKGGADPMEAACAVRHKKWCSFLAGKYSKKSGK